MEEEVSESEQGEEQNYEDFLEMNKEFKDKRSSKLPK